MTGLQVDGDGDFTVGEHGDGAVTQGQTQGLADTLCKLLVGVAAEHLNVFSVRNHGVLIPFFSTVYLIFQTVFYGEKSQNLTEKTPIRQEASLPPAMSANKYPAVGAGHGHM